MTIYCVIISWKFCRSLMGNLLSGPFPLVLTKITTLTNMYVFLIQEHVPLALLAHLVWWGEWLIMSLKENFMQKHWGESLSWATATGPRKPCSHGKIVRFLTLHCYLLYPSRKTTKLMATSFCFSSANMDSVWYPPITLLEKFPEHLPRWQT